MIKKLKRYLLNKRVEKLRDKYYAKMVNDAYKNGYVLSITKGVHYVGSYNFLKMELKDYKRRLNKEESFKIKS